MPFTRTVDSCLMSLLLSSIDSEALARIARDLSIVVVTYIRYPIARKFCPTETSLSTKIPINKDIFTGTANKPRKNPIRPAQDSL